jgi:hypothetical protein
MIGRPLPREVVFYDLPPAVLLAIGACAIETPLCARGPDILMIAVGTGMIVDAIEDIGR